MASASISGHSAARRRIPSEAALLGVRWAWSGRRRPTGERLLVPAGASLVALGLWTAFVLRPVSAPLEERVVWIEEPPAAVLPAVEEPPTPAQPTPPETEPDPPIPPAPLPLEATPPVAAPAPDPAFGLDDAVSTGGLSVATGSTLAKAPDPVVRPPEPSAGPVLVEAVPASVRPVVPRYPPRAEAMGMEADVVALVTTDASGNVVDVRIERSGGRDFDESVRRAVLSTTFVVPIRDGAPRGIAFRLPYRFRLD